MKYLLPFIIIVLFNSAAHTQEVVAPLLGNTVLWKLTDIHQKTQNKKTRTAILPFIEDFAYQGPYPDPNLWEDKKAYINNTMCSNPVNRGVATLDGLDQYGRPYVSSQNGISLADSLTSTTINLAGYTPIDSIFMSFFYQPQGLGFAPEEKDSVFLYFKNNNNQWKTVWQIRGGNLTVFKMAVVAITDPQYLHADFQFRFVNIASPNLNDDVWNIDYIKIDENRSFIDSIANDIGFTDEPTSILFPYTEMPYRHFLVNQNNWKSGAQTIGIRNLYGIPQTLSLSHSSREVITNTPVSTAAQPGVIVPLKASITANNPSYNIPFTSLNPYSKVVIEDKYFFNSVNSTDRKINDTITRQTVFDNYFAYDDGSAEKSYFLLPSFNFPSKTALSFRLNEPDTVRGLSVHFGPQVPTAVGKYFTILLYKQLAGSGFNDSVIAQKNLCVVMYDTTYNGFSNYAFDTPILVDSGTYYIGITQPANFGIDTLYYGLDVNNYGNLQHLYYNVSGSWVSSSVNASIMMRPLVGQYFTPTGIKENPIEVRTTRTTAYPNPTNGLLQFSTSVKQVRVYTINGQWVSSLTPSENKIDLSTLPNQLYLLQIIDKQNNVQNLKIIKQ